MEFQFQRGSQTPVTNKYILSDEKSKQKIYVKIRGQKMMEGLNLKWSGQMPL